MLKTISALSEDRPQIWKLITKSGLIEEQLAVTPMHSKDLKEVLRAYNMAENYNTRHTC